MSESRSMSDFFSSKNKYTKLYENWCRSLRYGYQMMKFQNTSKYAKISAFSIYRTANLNESNALVRVDFNATESVNSFSELLTPELKVLFHPAEEGTLDNYSSSTIKPIFYKFSYKFETENDFALNLKNIVSSMHALDSFDKENMRSIYSFFQIPNPNPIDQTIEILKHAYLKGAVFGLFSKFNVPRDVTNLISDYLDEKDAINIALTSKSAAKSGTTELASELKKIKY